MRYLAWGCVAFLTVFISVGLYLNWRVKNQGLATEFWNSYEVARVSFDEQHVPTIAAESWDKIIEAQGFVEASERLWQMDLFRRRALGRLAEWFGKDALEFDIRMQTQDRRAITERGVQLLPESERQACEQYAKGVNQFIASAEGRWSAEYVLLRVEPEPWTCADSLAVLMLMADQLSTSYEEDVSRFLVQKHLPGSWTDFLYTQEHPWSTPYFGTRQGVKLPDSEDYLPLTPIKAPQEARVNSDREEAVGSNNWSYRGKRGFFLANDPHLGQSVPGIWFAQRLRRSADEWVVGVSIPGLPGIVIGMNPYFAWAFTNIAEDVDDLLEETLSEDQSSYLVVGENGEEEWRPVRRKTYSIKVKGEEPFIVEGLLTHRGPLMKFDTLPGKLYARQWLVYKEGLLRLPVLAIGQAKSWEEFNKAIDQMRAPAQNALYVDRAGNLGYRSSGTGVVRRTAAKHPGPAHALEWRGFEPADKRPRLFRPNREVNSGKHEFLATANERVWVDDLGHQWASEDRKHRIHEYLSSSDALTASDMTTLHLDTRSAFTVVFLEWLKKNAKPKSSVEAELLKGFDRFEGDAAKAPGVFTQALKLESHLVDLLIDRVFNQYVDMHAESRDQTYDWALRRGWLLHLLITKDAFAAFGLKAEDTASYLLTWLVEQGELRPYYEDNRWIAQHPFVGRVPLIGSLFAVDEPIQFGSRYVVRVERPRFGASVRLVWSLSNPADSRWSLPIGQSGHIGAKAYKGLQQLWRDGGNFPVFADGYDWRFAEPRPLLR